MKHKKLLFLGNQSDKNFLPRLKPIVSTVTTAVKLDPVSTWTEVSVLCKSKNITGIISTSQSLLSRLLFASGKKNPSIDNYAGSYFEKDGIEIVFINPLEQLVTVPYGAFVAKRFISKLIFPEYYEETPEFNWQLVTPENSAYVIETLANAYAIATDIETTKTNLAITCIGYTGIYFENNKIITKTFVLPMDSLFALAVMRQINSNPVRKIFQNGKYDIAYLSRYNAVPINYMWDTINLMHCRYSELPKDLAFIQAFWVREASYWKDLAESDDLMERYKYNGLDTWATAIAWWALIKDLPQYAIDNYLQEFPLVFPSHLAEMTGIHTDQNKREEQKKLIDNKIKVASDKLDIVTGVSGFNVNSHVQVKQLMRIIGCKDIADESSDEKHIKACQFRHPLNNEILERVLDIRGYRKLVSTYLTDGKDFHGVILSSINPHGTDTGRQASKEHHFWCGLNIQNIPRGDEVKCTLIPPPGFKIAEVDLEQAESRDTAHIAGDEKLITNVTGIRDFHSINASAFFARPYEEIYSDEKKKTLDKVLRDLAKRVNHGANYLMGPDVLVDTMGLKNIYKAAVALKLPIYWTPRQIAEYLLEQFHKTYPFLASVFYPAVVAEVTSTSMLVSKATHHVEYQATTAGWTRYCFGNPAKNKRHKNSYVAHVPQSLNAMTLNKAFIKVFYTIAINPKHRDNFRLHAQIHDSILFSVRMGHEYLIQMVKECMEIPVTVLGYDGKERTFTVPAAIKAGKDGMGADRWSETE